MVETRAGRVSLPIRGSRKTEGFVGKGGATERASFRACAEASDTQCAPTRRQIGLKLWGLRPPNPREGYLYAVNRDVRSVLFMFGYFASLIWRMAPVSKRSSQMNAPVVRMSRYRQEKDLLTK